MHLAAELQDLGADGFDLALTGFEGAELDRLLASLDDDGAAAAESDADPALPAEPVTRAGDLWLLGPHRLLCGMPPAPTMWAGCSPAPGRG